ncbi:hypothetical protein CYMTET_16000 [Cymbomonas tetramitiformis]|uniref:Uncharacterized protein n=1 Tax=Cymbomonas tetramitiformis TaxID=36881 RepID=A0AAE0L8C8_9CHLO|nr:hypothetical protein CYMTET_16000 [Cymbomonas tetramitiformis]
MGGAAAEAVARLMSGAGRRGPQGRRSEPVRAEAARARWPGAMTPMGGAMGRRGACGPRKLMGGAGRRGAARLTAALGPLRAERGADER